LDVADRHFAGKVELSLLALMLGVKVSRFMFFVVHPNDDPEEHGNDGHEFSIASSTDHLRPTPAAAADVV